MIHLAPRKLVRVLLKRRLLAFLIALLAVVLPSGLAGWLLPSISMRDTTAVVRASSTLRSSVPAELVALEAGTQFAAGATPEGWSHLVLETDPRLATGDLDTVSAEGCESARRVRPLILADVRKEAAAGGSAYQLARVGVGLCAPGVDPENRVVVTTTSVEGTGSWTTKQRIILAAMAMESSRATLPVRTPTFALLRTPVTFLVAGSHKTIDICYALRVDSRSGSLETLIWQDLPDGSAADTPARRPSKHVFDSPMDVKARRLLGSLPVSWSFAVQQLPPGEDVEIPRSLRERVRAGETTPADAAAIEEAFRRLVSDGN